jgi:D-arabinan exo alpha-(1,3)/(1,5)-arabinofuranosidase (non-reducing end)
MARRVIGLLFLATLVGLASMVRRKTEASTPSASTRPISTRPFNGLTSGLGDLYRLSKAKTRSISAENFTGEKGKGGMATEGTEAYSARDLGRGWKISPSVLIKPKQVFTIADIKGPGAIQHIWMAPTGNWRFSILRVYWDGETTPSVEAPVGDFFASGWGRYAQINSLPIAVNPGSAFNSYWTMPFRKSARITMENLADEEMQLHYQVTYALTEIGDDAGYFHAQFRRTNPLPYKQVYTLLDGVKGEGHYVGTHMSWGANGDGWWGEGEIKFYMDGDTDYATIVGTGTEDYFCGSYNFENSEKQYVPFSTPFSGFSVVPKPDGGGGLLRTLSQRFMHSQSQRRFSLYRWHILDPIRFDKDLKVTIQALGYRGDRYQPLQDDIASVAYWYQREPHAAFPRLPARDQLKIQ